MDTLFLMQYRVLPEPVFKVLDAVQDTGFIKRDPWEMDDMIGPASG